MMVLWPEDPALEAHRQGSSGQRSHRPCRTDPVHAPPRLLVIEGERDAAGGSARGAAQGSVQEGGFFHAELRHGRHDVRD